MPREDHIGKSWEFLTRKEAARETFTLEELVEASGWKESTAKIYLRSKKLTDITQKTGDASYTVLPRIRSIGQDDYRALFPQAVKLFGDYNTACYSDILIYDFFMPLTHEKKLRAALDNLFYSDSVRHRLSEIGGAAIREELADSVPGEMTDDALLDWVADLVGNVFVGYSISHVNGRFRVGNLMCRTDAAEELTRGGSYLVDETTAVVRFIMRCPSSREAARNAEQGALDFSAVDEERQLIQWVFFKIFAEAVVKTVRGEEEIWLLEQGERPVLWVWEKATP